MNHSKSILQKKSFELAMMAVSYSKVLHHTRNFDLSSQVLRSGTSVMANILESKYAESKKDSLHKMTIALKEANEIRGWITLCGAHPSVPDPLNEFKDVSEECLAMLISTTRTLKRNLNS